ncbi:hypothetical protein D5086_007347 [Populus alba]|uniref:Uncharacterized protein n=1 Tax=Populus alba TaxID=43335 RepID=A0ACC4CN48_POPAL
MATVAEDSVIKVAALGGYLRQASYGHALALRLGIFLNVMVTINGCNIRNSGLKNVGNEFRKLVCPICTGLALIVCFFGYVVRPHFFGPSILNGTGAPCTAPSVK